MQCGYCDQNQENLLSTCMTCHAHFCNTNDKPTALSHILKHLKQTQHNSFSLPNHGELKCKICYKNNLLTLSKDLQNDIFCSNHLIANCTNLVQNKKLVEFQSKNDLDLPPGLNIPRQEAVWQQKNDQFKQNNQLKKTQINRCRSLTREKAPPKVLETLKAMLEGNSVKTTENVQRSLSLARKQGFRGQQGVLVSGENFGKQVLDSKNWSRNAGNKGVKNAQIQKIKSQIQPQMVQQWPDNAVNRQSIIDRFSETFLDQFDQLEDLKMQIRSGNSNSIRLEISSLTAQINDNIAKFKATGLQVIGSVEKRVKQFLDEEVKSKNVDVLDVMRQLDELNRQSQNLGVGSQARQDEMKKVVPQQAQQVPQAGNQAETLKKFKNDIRGLIEEYNILKAQIDVKASASLILKVTKLIRKMDATRSEFMQTGIALPAEMNRFLASFDEKLENEQICKQMQLMVQNAEQLIESISGSGPENEEFSNQIIQQIDEFDAVFQAGNGKVSDRIKEFRTVHQTTLKAFIETGSTISEDVKECMEQFYRGVQNKVKARLQYESAESIPEAPSQPQTPTYRTSTRTAVCQPFNQTSTPQKYVPSAPQQQGQPLLVQTAIYQPIAPQFAQPNVQQSQPSQPPNQKLSGPPPTKQKRSQVPPPQHQQPQTSQIGPPPPQPRPTPQQLSAPPGPQQSQQLSAPPQPIRPNYQNPSHLASPPPPNSNQPSRPPPQQYLSPPPAPMRPQRQNNQKPPHLASPPPTMTVQPPFNPTASTTYMDPNFFKTAATSSDNNVRFSANQQSSVAFEEIKAMDMCFFDSEIVFALSKHRGNQEAALNYLINGSISAVQTTPLVEQPVSQFYQPKFQPPVQIPVRGQVPVSIPRTNEYPAQLQRIKYLRLAHSDDQIMQALKYHNGNVELATNDLIENIAPDSIPGLQNYYKELQQVKNLCFGRSDEEILELLEMYEGVVELVIDSLMK